MKKLNVFDFDNTLFKSPLNTPENHKRYEKETGIPWIITKDLAAQLSKKHKKKINPRFGWWGRAETLQPPIVPDPPPKDWLLPTHKELLEAKKDPNAVTIVMTGRHSSMQQQVLKILHHYEILDIVKDKDFYINKGNIGIYFLGQDGPLSQEYVETKPSQTFPWKCWIISQFLLLYSSVEEVEIWDDREEHVLDFQKFGQTFHPTKFKVNHVK